MIFLTADLLVGFVIMVVFLVTFGYCIHRYNLKVIRGDKQEPGA